MLCNDAIVKLGVNMEEHAYCLDMKVDMLGRLKEKREQKIWVTFLKY